MQEYYQKNRDKILAGVTINYQKNRDRVLEYQKEYNLKNWDKVHERVRENGSIWSKKNKAKRNAITQRYRSKKMKSIDISADMEKIKEFYLLAEKLTEQMGIRYVVDHIIPLSKGGKHHQNNLQVVTEADNLKKSNRYPYKIPIYFNPSNDYVTHT